MARRAKLRAYAKHITFLVCMPMCLCVNVQTHTRGKAVLQVTSICKGPRTASIITNTYAHTHTRIPQRHNVYVLDPVAATRPEKPLPVAATGTTFSALSPQVHRRTHIRTHTRTRRPDRDKMLYT